MDWNDILQSFLMTIIQVLLPVLLTILVAWVKEQWVLAKSRIPAEQLAFASEMARQFVLAAEQNGLTGAIKNEAAAKKDWVINRLEEELRSKGVNLDLRVLSDLIESAVYESLNQFK